MNPLVASRLCGPYCRRAMVMAMGTLGLVAMAPAHAVQIVPVSYSMPNGSSGSYGYWDESYNGTGCVTCSGVALSGGLGDLTDGIIASASWNVVEAPAGPGPYVGWQWISPTINFSFGQVVGIDSVTFHFDDAPITGVFAPLSVVIAGQTYAVVNPPGDAPFSFTASGLNLNAASVSIKLVPNGNWVFASEISFANLIAVPEAPTSAMLLAGGLVLLGTLRRRRTG